MSSSQTSIFGGLVGADYLRGLEQQLGLQLAIVRQHADGHDHTTPWELDGALSAIRWLADEIRTVTLSNEDVPF